MGDKNICEITGVVGFFCWRTEHHHHDNNFTMGEFLENHLPEEFSVDYRDGTYAEVSLGAIKYKLSAQGDGDSYNHKVQWELID